MASDVVWNTHNTNHRENQYGCKQVGKSYINYEGEPCPNCKRNNNCDLIKFVVKSMDIKLKKIRNLLDLNECAENKYREELWLIADVKYTWQKSLVETVIVPIQLLSSALISSDEFGNKKVQQQCYSDISDVEKDYFDLAQTVCKAVIEHHKNRLELESLNKFYREQDTKLRDLRSFFDKFCN